jgi:hypothetical protein
VKGQAFVGGMDGGRYLVEAALTGVEEGVANGWALASGVEADLEEGVAEGWTAALGDVAQVLGIAGLDPWVEHRIVNAESPWLLSRVLCLLRPR